MLHHLGDDGDGFGIVERGEFCGSFELLQDFLVDLCVGFEVGAGVDYAVADGFNGGEVGASYGFDEDSNGFEGAWRLVSCFDRC